jgi:hypothetical protein
MIGICRRVFIVVLVFALSGSVLGAEGLDSGRVGAVAGMVSKTPGGFGVPAGDRGAWEKLAGNEAFKGVVGEAEGLLGTAIPEQSDELFLDFSRTGNRSRWQRVAGRRRGRIGTLVIAECLEDKGRFVGAFEELAEALCSERTWVMPAHDRGLRNFNGKMTDIDLGSSMLGWNLAMADYLLGDKLSEESRGMIRENLERRIFKPYEDMVAGRRERNWWMTTTNNWNAVCLGGVTGSALAVIESRERRAAHIVAAEKYSQNFLKGFTDDGYCSEGLGYWNYGYGYYVLLSEAIYQATGGKVDILDNKRARAAGAFGANIEIHNGVYPAFADCSVRAQPSSGLMYFVSRRFGMGLEEWERRDPAGASGYLYSCMMYSFANSASKAPSKAVSSKGLPLRSWFDKAGVLISRPGPGSNSRLAVALKGGHNAEHHNHNDVGSFVAVVGDEALLLDPGGEVYPARTFSSRRYESKVLNSFGHPVPVVAGKLQRTGGKARGRILKSEFTDERDMLELDISSAYDVPELKSLVRRFEYSRRGSGSLLVKDEVSFSKPSTFGTAVITLDKWKKVSESSLTIYGGDEALRVDIDTGGEAFEIKAETIEEDVSAPRKPVRLGINFKEPVRKGVIAIRLTPAGQAGAR